MCWQVAGVTGLRFLSLDRYGKPGVLVAHLNPPFSLRMDTMSDQQVVDEVLATLLIVFGTANVKREASPSAGRRVSPH